MEWPACRAGGETALAAGSVGGDYRSGVSPDMQTEATITCPLCGTHALATMPEDACQYFYRCTGCGETLKPKDGDCCVFCSYSDAVCPPKQS